MNEDEFEYEGKTFIKKHSHKNSCEGCYFDDKACRDLDIPSCYEDYAIFVEKINE